MAKKASQSYPEFERLHLSIENEDWIAFEGTSTDFEKLGRVFLEFAQSKEQGLTLDGDPPIFPRNGFGITLHRAR